MDTFFRRHFKRKVAGGPSDYCRHRRPSVAVPTSKARRRSSAGLPSAILTQRRRSSVQVQGILPAAGGCCLGGDRLGNAHYSRRRSSTTTPSQNPRFAVRRRRAGRLRTIDTHLLGPSMLLASLIQMTEEEEGDAPPTEELQGEGLRKGDLSISDSEGDGNSQPSGSESEESRSDS
ncbi:hypothetical protein SKAU_G00351460, partial [Synaphobranchus kaupii]